MKKTTFILLLLFIFSFHSKAQVVSGYLFSQSTETYAAVVGTNTVADGDDGFEEGIPIGFGFNFGGVVYSTFSISTNGWINLGGPIVTQSWVNNLSNTSNQSPLIAAFWDDHNRTSGSIQYALSGSAPNRILEIGWDSINIGNGGNVSSTAFGSFKMRLFETTGLIDFVYGPIMNLAGGLSASIGLNDLTSFLSVTPAIAATTSNTVANNNINSTGLLLGQKFTFTPQPQCQGTPNPGNSLASVTSICSDQDFDLSLENEITGFGVSYQWQSSINGVDFIDIINSNTANLTINQTETTTYHCIVTCSNTSITSTPIQVGLNNPSTCFCFPNYTIGKTFGDLISNVIITGTTLSNNTGTDPVNPFYTYFTGLPNYTATFQSGYAYQMNITVGTYEDQNIAVWIDYNDDTIFSPEERVGFTSESIGSNGIGVFTINLACDALPGLHRMRIRDVFQTDAITIDPCSAYQYGETEDYDITIETALGCQAPYDLNTINLNPTSGELIWNSGCGQLSWDVHVTIQGGGAPTGLPSNPNVTSPIVVVGLTPFTNYEFYVRSDCGVNGLSNWAGPFLFSTLPLAVSNDDCEFAVNLIPGGTFIENVVIATNVGATKTIGQPNPTCAIFGFGGDVWFKTIVPADGNITIEVQSDPGSLVIDTGLTAFTGDCTGLTTISCSDDEGVGAFSRLNLTGLNPGETIYARVWEYANDVYGTFQVSAWNTTLKTSDFNSLNFKYYPNPVKDYLNLSLALNITQVEVYNLLGQQVLTKKIDSNASKIDMTTLSQGTYMVKVYANNEVKTIKLIKE